MKKYVVVRGTGSWLAGKGGPDNWYWTKTKYKVIKFDSIESAEFTRSMCDAHFKFLPGTTAVREWGK